MRYKTYTGMPTQWLDTKKRPRVGRMERVMWSLLVLIGVLTCLMLTLVVVPFVVRALPGRYAVRLPAVLLELRYPNSAMLSTPETQSTYITVPTLPPTLTPTPLPTVGNTPEVTPKPTSTLLPTSTPLPPLPESFSITGLRHERQGWNNCGPTTLAMALSYWGRTETQADIAPVLKPDSEDKNVSPEEMADYVHSLDLEALIRVGGDLQLLKRLLVNGYPVIVETWVVRDERDQLGHYLLLTGYDDAEQHFLTYDSLHGPDLPIGYAEFDELWRVFNRVYMVVAPAEYVMNLADVLGAPANERWAVEHALEVARAEAKAPPETCVAYAACNDARTFAWFNVGSNLVALERYEEAAAAYDQSRILGLHYRMLWYQFGPYEAYYAVGRYNAVIKLASETLKITRNLEESYYWRGRAYQAQGDIDAARDDYQTALRYHEEWPPAGEALAEVSE